MRLGKTLLWSRLVAVSAPFFRSEYRWRAWFKLGLLIGLLLTTNGLNVVNSFVGADFMTSLERRNFGRFYALAGVLAAVFACATAVEVWTRYTEQQLGILWREWLTHELLDRYLKDHTYRRLAARGDIDNPDQRICEDVKTFTATTLSFLILLLNAGLTLLAFLGILWSITPWLVFTAVVYAGCGSLGTLLLGWRLVNLDNLQLQKEADFRFTLARFRDQAGTMAQPRGDREARSRLGQRLAAVVDNFRRIIRVTRNLSFFTTGYNYLPQIIPVAVVAPLYFRGEIPFGTVTQSAMAFSQVLAAFSLLVSQFQQLSAYAAVVGRVGMIWEATGEESPSPAEQPVEAGPARRAGSGRAGPVSISERIG